MLEWYENNALFWQIELAIVLRTDKSFRVYDTIKPLQNVNGNDTERRKIDLFVVYERNLGFRFHFYNLSLSGIFNLKSI